MVANQLDLVVVGKGHNRAVMIDLGKSKREQHQKEGPQLERMWGVKSLAISVVIGAFRAPILGEWVQQIPRDL